MKPLEAGLRVLQAPPLLADPRFLPMMTLGLVDYWMKTKTQPDACAGDECDIPLCMKLREAR